MDVGTATQPWVRAPGAQHVVTVVGLMAPSNGAVGVSQMFASPGGLRQWPARGASSELVVRGTGGIAQAALAQQVSGLAPNLYVTTTDALRKAALSNLTNQVDVMGRFLEGFAVIALIVAGLVIANTFRILMAQRIRDIALLRCVGAERWQVFAMSLGEAALLGVCAALAGTAAGLCPQAARRPGWMPPRSTRTSRSSLRTPPRWCCRSWAAS